MAEPLTVTSTAQPQAERPSRISSIRKPIAAQTAEPAPRPSLRKSPVPQPATAPCPPAAQTQSDTRQEEQPGLQRSELRPSVAGTEDVAVVSKDPAPGATARTLPEWPSAIRRSPPPASPAAAPPETTQPSVGPAPSGEARKPAAAPQSAPPQSAPAGRPGLRARLAKIYLDYAPKAASGLTTALEGDDFVSLKLVAHSLKSSSANVGAEAVSITCRDIEAAAEYNDRDRCRLLVERVQGEIAEVVDTLRRETDAGSPGKVA